MKEEIRILIVVNVMSFLFAASIIIILIIVWSYRERNINFLYGNDEHEEGKLIINK